MIFLLLLIVLSVFVVFGAVRSKRKKPVEKPVLKNEVKNEVKVKNEIKNEVKKEVRSRPPVDNTVPTTKAKFRKMAVIWEKPADEENCNRCKSQLIKETVYIAAYHSTYSKENIAKYVEGDMYTCIKCKYICADQTMLSKLKAKSKGL